MIVELVVGLIATVVEFIGGLMPTMSVPGFVTSIAGHVSTITGFMAPLGNWIPFGAAGTATLVVLGAAVIALAIKLVRIIASFLTAGGGSAA